MDQRDDRDQQVRELFRAARRLERAQSPDFASLARGAAGSSTPWPGVRRLFALTLATALGGGVLAAAALWLVEERNARIEDSGLSVAMLHSLVEATRGPGEPEAPPAEAAAPPAPGDSPSSPRPRPDSIPEPPEPETRRDTGEVAEAFLEPEVLETQIEPPYEAYDTVQHPPAGSTTAPAQERSIPDYCATITRVVPPRTSLRFGQVGPAVHASRGRDFNAAVGGVNQVNPLTGQFSGAISAEAMQEIVSGLRDGDEEYRRTVQSVLREYGQLQRSAGEAEPDSGFNTERYDVIEENDFVAVLDQPLSTFSIDVDTASYANTRRFLEQGRLPPPDAVRIEELINSFEYDDPPPSGGEPISASVEIADCPWNPEHRLARIGLRGREVSRGEHAGSNLVFLVDVSGSMQDPGKLPLLKQALRLLVEQLDGRDRVALVAYAGASGLVLPSTPGDARDEILDAIDGLQAGGRTNGAAGLKLAYRTARENLIPGGVNRVVLATDGDFNVGVTSRGELLRLIVQDARNGIFLTVLGFGRGNYQDAMLETLADRSNGNYHYIDGPREARKVLVEQLQGTLIAIAKDVKVQVEFNPAVVGAYRLIGYENRALRSQEFNDDRRDAGEFGAGQTVTALYELVPPGRTRPLVDPPRYRRPHDADSSIESDETLLLKIRYKEPDGEQSRLLSWPVRDAGDSYDTASDDFRFAASVAAFGMLLRDSPQRGDLDWERVERMARESAGPDREGHRTAFLDLVRRAACLPPRRNGE